jgi:trehalose-6-phosphatase
MKTYCEKTEGASIERKESLIVWNYKDTDQGLGDFQAKELTNHLDHLFSYLQIEVIQGKKSLAVIPRQLKRVSKLIDLVGEICEAYDQTVQLEKTNRLPNVHWRRSAVRAGLSAL